MWRRITSRGLQVFVAGVLASKGFSAWFGVAYYLAFGSNKTAMIWALVGLDLFMSIGLLIGNRIMVRVVQLYLLFHVISGIIIVIIKVATGSSIDPRYPSEFSMVAYIIQGPVEWAILLMLLLWSQPIVLTNIPHPPNQSMQPTAGRSDV